MSASREGCAQDSNDAARDRVLDLVCKYGAAEYAHGAVNHGASSFEERVAARKHLCAARDALRDEIERLTQQGDSPK